MEELKWKLGLGNGIFVGRALEASVIGILYSLNKLYYVMVFCGHMESTNKILQESYWNSISRIMKLDGFDD